MSESESSESVLRLEGLVWGVPAALKAGDPPLLRGVDLTLPRGAWYALTGPSGVGKTTVLSLAAGLMAPTEGEVCVLGRPLSTLDSASLGRLRNSEIGLVFQNYHLDDSRGTLDNILLPGYFGAEPWHQLETRAKTLAEHLGLSEHLHKSVSVLSGGQRQRVAVARALLNEPKLLLADEPTGALDRETADLVLQLLRQRVAEGMSILSVTHSGLVLAEADCAYRFRDGKIEVRSDE